MSPEDALSMCCRLRLDKSELRKRGGGLFGSNPLTGSIGVVTLNLPRYAYLAGGSEFAFFNYLEEFLELAKNSLEIKRKVIEKYTEQGLYPYSENFLKGIKSRTGKYWDNHFSTIGLIGMNEACLNLLDTTITSPEGQAFAKKTMEFMRNTIQRFQEETGNVYNLEATPAEGTSYRMAKKDTEMFSHIITAGTDEVPYYTNSTQLPVGYTDDIFETLELQDELQSMYTGGTVLHLYLGEAIKDKNNAKTLIKQIFTKYKLPYISLTPTFSVCNTHGYINKEMPICPTCGRDRNME